MFSWLCWLTPSATVVCWLPLPCPCPHCQLFCCHHGHMVDALFTANAASTAVSLQADEPWFTTNSAFAFIVYLRMPLPLSSMVDCWSVVISVILYSLNCSPPSLFVHCLLHHWWLFVVFCQPSLTHFVALCPCCRQPHLPPQSWQVSKWCSKY